MEEVSQTLPGMLFTQIFMNREFSRSFFIMLLYLFKQAQRALETGNSNTVFLGKVRKEKHLGKHK